MISGDPKISAAISKVLQRAERMRELDQITRTYVEVRVVPQLLNENNQIIFGRRGTGKTHLFRFLENELISQKTPVVVYLDCRTLGSASDFSNSEIPIVRRAQSLFNDIVSEIVEKALTFIAENAPKGSEKALLALDEIEKAVSSKIDYGLVEEVTERTLIKTGSEASGEVALSVKDLFSVKGGGKSMNASDTERTVKYTTPGGEKVEFPDLHFWLKTLCDEAQTEIYVLIDEWSSLPLDLQPLLAEFLKRSFLPVAAITVKIAALEYRSQFNATSPDNANLIGFELGSDISSNLDLDDYFVFDRDPSGITEKFAEILFRHVGTSLDTAYLKDTHGIEDKIDFLKAVLTDPENFREIVRASEGVVRDMLNIFTNAYFETLRLGKSRIDKKSITESSRQWFEKDKHPNLDPELQKVLRRIVDEVIGNKKARSFLVPKELEKNEKIQKLFDARVIHLIARGYADKDNPGVRYNVFGLDYGTYVDLMNTTKQPELDFMNVDNREADDEVIVPFDDKRSIRRIILTEDILK